MKSLKASIASQPRTQGSVCSSGDDKPKSGAASLFHVWKGFKVHRSKAALQAFAAMLCLLHLVPSAAQESRENGLRAGSAKVDITPTDLKGLTNQWGTPFVGVHDPIFVRALVLDNGQSEVAIVTADLVEFGDTERLRLRLAQETGIPPDHLILTAVHNHGAPKPNFSNPDAPNANASQIFTRGVYEKILEVVKRAKASLQPARMGVGTGNAYVNINRDQYDATGWHLGVDEDRPSDRTVRVLRFESLTGEPIAILFNYAVHSVVAGPLTDQVTGDLAGAAERYVEHHYKDKAVALFTIGAAGDQNPMFTGPGERPEEAVPVFDAVNAQGLMLGAETVRVADGVKNTTGRARIEAAERTIACPAKQPTHPAPGLPQGHPADVTNTATLPPVEIHLGLILINNVALTAVSGEVYGSIYSQLLRASPLRATMMITLSNGRVGYIPDDASYDLPLFEVQDSPLARGCAERGIITNLVEMIAQHH